VELLSSELLMEVRLCKLLMEESPHWLEACCRHAVLPFSSYLQDTAASCDEKLPRTCPALTNMSGDAMWMTQSQPAMALP